MTMSVMTICDEQAYVLEELRDFDAISARLGELGVAFERWATDRALAIDADQEAVLAAYAGEVRRLNQQFGFQSVDVVALRPDFAQKDELRQKFLTEHTHADFEVRFFVGGSGLFYLHVGERVYLVLCEKGDLISVPAGTTHWFDMGANPDFKCIRFFTTPDGWVGEPTGATLCSAFPDFDQYRAALD
jgi:1,2-dihydroxy-3-keto-5-methylthiopentene dioxygenase